MIAKQLRAKFICSGFYESIFCTALLCACHFLIQCSRFFVAGGFAHSWLNACNKLGGGGGGRSSESCSWRDKSFFFLSEHFHEHSRCSRVGGNLITLSAHRHHHHRRHHNYE
jgi:hypothetical protein